MKKIILSLFSLTLVATSFPGKAAESSLGGNLSNITSAPVGLLVMMDSGVPGNCAGTPYNWMLIKEEYKTMISVALTMWTTGNKGAIVYTSGIDQSGYCIINQLDPYN